MAVQTCQVVEVALGVLQVSHHHCHCHLFGCTDLRLGSLITSVCSKSCFLFPPQLMCFNVFQLVVCLAYYTAVICFIYLYVCRGNIISVVFPTFGASFKSVKATNQIIIVVH